MKWSRTRQQKARDMTHMSRKGCTCGACTNVRKRRLLAERAEEELKAYVKNNYKEI